MSKYIPHKLNVEITDEQWEALNRLLPYGVKKPIFGIIVDDLIEVIDKHGPIILGALLSRSLKLGDFMKLPHEVRTVLQLDKREENGYLEPKAKPVRAKRKRRLKSNSGNQEKAKVETPDSDK